MVALDYTQAAHSIPGTTVSFAPKLITRAALVLDDSGSMQSIVREAQHAFDTLIGTFRENATANPKDEVTLSIYKFANRVDRVVFNRDAKDIKGLDFYRPDGGTALWAAALKALQDLRTLENPSEANAGYLLMVVTDGEENQSGPLGVNIHMLQQAIRDALATGYWTITFMVPPGHYQRDQYKNALVRMGIPEGNIAVWEATREGAKQMEQQTSVATQTYMTSRAGGQRATTSYFEFKKVNQTDVRKQCQNIQRKIQIWQVNDRTRIDDFFDSKLGASKYIVGEGFYQLIKNEYIQPEKAIVIVDNTNGEVFGGDDARKLLGLLNHQVRVRPLDQPDWTIYVQSLTRNRILPGIDDNPTRKYPKGKFPIGSKVIYYKGAGV